MKGYMKRIALLLATVLTLEMVVPTNSVSAETIQPENQTIQEEQEEFIEDVSDDEIGTTPPVDDGEASTPSEDIVDEEQEETVTPSENVETVSEDEVSANEVSINEVISISEDVIEPNGIVLDNKVYIYPEQESFKVEFSGFDEVKTISKVQMIDANNKVYAQNDYIYTYSGIVNMESRYNKLPVGNYNLLFVYDDDTTDLLTDIVMVTNEPLVSDITSSYDYDSEGDFLYLAIKGHALVPEKMNYSFVYDDDTYSAEYVNHKVLSDGFAVKLKKNNWPSDMRYSIDISVSTKDGSLIHGNRTFNDGIYSSVYYCEYNTRIMKLETAFSTSISGKSYTAVLCSYDNENIELAEASGISTDGCNNIQFYEIGTQTPYNIQSGSYIIRFTIEENTYTKYIYVRLKTKHI